jgi:glutathione-regulated potassium-efflux system ancillary protein KefC
MGKSLAACYLQTVIVLDHDAEQIEGVRRFGYRIFYGDATRLDLLRTAGAGSARLIVVAIDNPEQSIELVDLLKEHFPKLHIVARARNVDHFYKLRDRGITDVERETFESALLSARSALTALGATQTEARNAAFRFKSHNLALLEEMRSLRHDEKQLIAVARASREQLEAQLAKEREQSGGDSKDGLHRSWSGSEKKRD